jgi:hypothetical protein
MLRWKCFVLSLTAALGLAAPASAKPIIAFNLAQGFADDFVARANTAEGNAAIENMIGVLQTYQAMGYTTCALINPQQSDKSKVISLLDRLQARNVPFMLDVISSDCLPQPPHIGAANGNAPAAPNSGMSVWNNLGGDPNSPGGIQFYLSRYPNHLIGFRIMEPEWIFQQYKELGWGTWNAQYYIESFVSMASMTGRFVQYSSTCWDTPRYGDATNPPPDGDVVQSTQNSAKWLAAKYPNVIYTTWQTNDGTNINRLSLVQDGQPLAPWRSLINFPGVRGIGVSDQSWMTGLAVDGQWVDSWTCPVSALLAFVHNALDPDPNYPATGIVQFEPYWYFFNLSHDGKGTNNTGTANWNNNQIAWPFGVTLPYQ